MGNNNDFVTYAEFRDTARKADISSEREAELKDAINKLTGRIIFLENQDKSKNNVIYNLKRDVREASDNSRYAVSHSNNALGYARTTNVRVDAIEAEQSSLRSGLNTVLSFISGKFKKEEKGYEKEEASSVIQSYLEYAFLDDVDNAMGRVGYSITKKHYSCMLHAAGWPSHTKNQPSERFDAYHVLNGEKVHFFEFLFDTIENHSVNTSRLGTVRKKWERFGQSGTYRYYKK